MPARIYQLFVRLFGNVNLTNTYDGTAAANGVGKLADINDAALAGLVSMGITHVWLTGVIRHATLTDYSSVDPALAADPPDIVKGRAGSPYAIKDYYDVAPDLAVDPVRRIAELRALLDRIHAHGMKALIDFVPNHVSRGYASAVKPETTFGRRDDVTQFFSPANNFFYLVSPPHQALRLTYPAGAPPREGLTSTLRSEDGAEGRVARATGNNQTSPSPSASDWYEAIKLNYGFNFVDGSTHYEPPPVTWLQMDEVLAYWQSLGVDGFRCDFAHWIPVELWRWVIGRARERRDAYFLAEAYDNPDAAPGFSPQALIHAGFDALYDYRLYNLAKGLFTQGKWCNDLDGQFPDGALEPHLLRYTENHDECRVAAPVRPGDPGNSGFGSKEAGFAVTALLQTLGPAPTLLYNGQEVGERGMIRAGFGEGNGRTSIFDYGAMPELARWVNGHAYDGEGLAPDQRELRAQYAVVGQTLREPAFAHGHRWSLQSANKDAPEYGNRGQWVYALLRFDREAGQCFVVVANLSASDAFAPSVRIPGDALRAAGLPDRGRLRFVDALSPYAVSARAEELPGSGLKVELPPRSVRLMRVTPG